MSKYNYIDFKKDPRTRPSRLNTTLLSCIDEGIYDLNIIFSRIDKAYSVGKHKSPSYIKMQKKTAAKLLVDFGFKHEQNI